MSGIAKELFWVAPSGRLHWLRHCSGAAPVMRMRPVKLTKFELSRWPAEKRCRCVERKRRTM